MRPNHVVLSARCLLKTSLLLFALTQLCFGQGWIVQDSGTNNWLFGASFVDENNGTVVGYAETILHTTNGGSSWIQQASGATHPLLGVHFTSLNAGVAVGVGGTIIRTVNGGATWTTQASGTGEDLYSVTFTDANNGYAVGSYGTILKTTDGGQTWSPQVSNSRDVLYRVKFTSATNGYIVGGFREGVILRTTNGGTTWSRQTTATTTHLFGVAFANANVGVAVGMGGTILRTTDAGVNWTFVTAWGGTAQLLSVTFRDETTAVAVGAGLPLISHDAGLTWKQQYAPQVGGFQDVVIAGDSVAVIVGTNGLVLRTAPSRGWQIHSFGTFPQLNGVSFADTSNGVAVGLSGTIVWTTNGGTTWGRVNSGVSTQLIAVTMVNPSVAFAIGDSGTILRTTDGGTTWTKQSSGIVHKLRGISFVSPSIGTAVGDSGYVLRTTNGGQTWLKQNLGSGTAYSVAFANASLGLILAKPVFGSAYVWRTIDSGATWTRITIPPIILLMQGYLPITFNTPATATFATANGKIYNSTDGGLTWSVQQSGVTTALNGIDFANANVGLLVGMNGVILGTTDGGTTWLAQNSNVFLGLTSVAMPSPSFAVAVGADGIILQTHSGVILSSGEPAEIPRLFGLGQNYPNPFNPTTTIPFFIAHRSSVALKVYDLLGREVTTLAAGPYEAGSHSIVWNARGVASGVYLCRLVIDGSYADSKKLVLIR